VVAGAGSSALEVQRSSLLRCSTCVLRLERPPPLTRCRQRPDTLRRLARHNLIDRAALAIPTPPLVMAIHHHIPIGPLGEHPVLAILQAGLRSCPAWLLVPRRLCMHIFLAMFSVPSLVSIFKSSRSNSMSTQSTSASSAPPPIPPAPMTTNTPVSTTTE
jgi:hypothetical protein